MRIERIQLGTAVLSIIKSLVLSGNFVEPDVPHIIRKQLKRRYCDQFYENA